MPMPVTEVIEKAGFEKDDRYADDVYGHSATEMLLVVKEGTTMVVSDTFNIVSSFPSNNHYELVSALMFLSDCPKITSTSEPRIPIFSGIR